MRALFHSIPFLRKLRHSLDNQHVREEFVRDALGKIEKGSTILDAGCGSQRYRQWCRHLTYKAQDFGQYAIDEKKMIGSDKDGQIPYAYGKLDYVGDIWRIDEADNAFDAILCTEVIEHIPYPNETIKEFSRLLKPGGTLILTAPSNCLRHMDPYFFYSGFSDRWYEKILDKNSFAIERLDPVGDYYSWLAVEMARTAASHSLLAKLLVSPAFLYFYNKRKTELSVDTLCMGYHIIARRK